MLGTWWWRLWSTRRFECFANRLVKGCNLVVQEVDVFEMLGMQEAMMVSKAPVKRLFERRAFGAQPTLSQRCQHAGLGLAIDQSRQHGTSRHASDVTDDRGKLDVRPFQGFLQSVDHGGAVAYQIGTLTGQVAEVALPGGGMKLGRSKPCASSSASYSASRISVLRPGTCLTCWALTTRTRKEDSRTA